MSDLVALWAELRKDTSKLTGVVRRRINKEAPCKVFAGIEQPEGRPCLITEFDESVRLRQRSLPRSRGFSTTVQSLNTADPQHSGRRLVIALSDARFEDIFAILCEDIRQALVEAKSQSACVAAGIERLDRWQRFLQKHSGSGLSEEEQRGLAGELVFLRDVALQNLDPPEAMDSWVGPKGRSQDYEIPGASVEVKTTIASPHQMIRISNVRQLDDTGLPALFLFVLPIDVHREAGQTLPDLIEEIRALLSTPSETARIFEDRLLEAGYMDSHAEKYKRDRYVFRAPSYYRVTEGFPRIIESDLVQGVGDVKYSIAVAACGEFQVDEVAMLSAMETHEYSD